jgi:hypothetical protein
VSRHAAACPPARSPSLLRAHRAELGLADGALAALAGATQRARAAFAAQVQAQAAARHCSEGVYGLVRALQTAGSRDLMTLWPLNEALARDFMDDFYRAWLGAPTPARPFEALRRTQLDSCHYPHLSGDREPEGLDTLSRTC